MNLLARAGWIASAACFGVLLSSIVHVTHVGLIPELLLLLVAAVAFVRPLLGVSVVTLLAPVVGVLAARRWNDSVAWPEAVVCAVLTGLALDAARVPRRLARSIGAPALVFGVIVVASLITGLGVVALRLGPSFTDALLTHVTREHFIDVRGFPALHAGLLLVEGVLLFVLAARLALPEAALRQVVAATVAGGAIAAALNVNRLVEGAARSDTFWTSLVDLTSRFRWNVHYPDFNAAGSYFVLALVLSLGLVLMTRGSRRVGSAVAAVLIAVGLWLTNSRAAFLAGAIALAAAFASPYITRGRARAFRLVATAAAVAVAIAVIAVALPQRGNQQSSVIATDVRLGLLQTGGRMIAAHPVFGIGLGEFYQRSGEFSSPDLIAKFPVAVHENAHNNFLQIAAELGLAGGVAFTWLIVAALVALGRLALAPGPSVTARFVLAAIGAFVLTSIGGHPLLVPQPAFVFWTVLGAATGFAAPAADDPARSRPWVWIVCLAIAVTLPWRMQAMLRDADLEHVGIGVSSVFQTAPDGTRYREAEGHATLFAPAGAIKISINPRTSVPVRLEVRLGGRVADVITLVPNTWNDLRLPARTERSASRFVALDLRVLDDEKTVIWITKVQPIQ